MNLTDLTDVLHHHSELPEDATHGPRMAGIRAKVRAGRRRRLVAAATCLAAVLGVAFALTTPVWRNSQPADPLTFPDYHNGTRILAQTSGQAPTSNIAVRFVLTKLDPKPWLFTHCTSNDQQQAAEITINGRSAGLQTCHDVDAAYGTELDWAHFGVEIGSPVVIVMSAGVQITGEPRPVPDELRFSIAVGEPVPPENYLFPPRPETLPALEEPPSIHDRIAVARADQNRPNGTWQTTVEWPDERTVIHLASNTPGRMRVLVNDVQVIDRTTWTYGLAPTDIPDYRFEDFGLKVEAGETATITVITERFTGDWKVWLSRW